MFYSHEILTSPEHGVATIWLVATLGSKSVTRRVNRKSILDVDIPRACNVIMEPEAPMALRLQGSLLYGVSRVFNQQCGYTLTDVQAMHDRMRAMLKVVPGGGLDPMAGRARPEQLILPYDPSFMPEVNLPGLDIDLARLTVTADMDESRESFVFGRRTPDISQSALSQDVRLQLDLSPDDYLKDLEGYVSDMSGSALRKNQLGRIAAAALDEEQGVLLQPDFEFDEDGNIIELGAKNQVSERDQPMSETSLNGEVKEGGDLGPFWDYEPMQVDDDREIVARDRDDSAPHSRLDKSKSPANPEAIDQEEPIAETREPTMRAARRHVKFVVEDDQTALRNTDLAQLNNEYVQNMAAALKRKLQNKLPTRAKKNAVFWVFGRGIGSVGVGMGASRAPLPLGVFSGDELHALLQPDVKRNGRKRSHSVSEGSSSESEGRRVRAREDEEEPQIGRGGLTEDDLMHDDVEIGRHGSSALRDDHSSMMPWNITASIKSSRHGSSAAKGFPRYGSVSDHDSGLAQLSALGRARSRLTSASPLAGRGFPVDLEGLGSLDIPGNDDPDLLDFELDQYLHPEDEEDHGEGGGRAGSSVKKRAIPKPLLKSTLDQESLNFLEFMTDKLSTAENERGARSDDSAGPSTPRRQISDLEGIAFSSLLPPQETSCSVATHGLMHILTLATKGFIDVHQKPYEDLSSEEYGVQYEYGEIYMRLSGV